MRIPQQAWLIALCVNLAACARLEDPAFVPRFVELDNPLTIPANRAHAKFQAGQQRTGVDRYEPWCELVIRTVAEEPQRVEAGRFAVKTMSHRFVKDYNLRIAPTVTAFNCDDVVFQEATLWMDAVSSPEILYIRCFAPYANCEYGPPPSPAEIQAIVGTHVRIDLGGDSLLP